MAGVERGIGRLVDHLDAPQMVTTALAQPRGEALSVEANGTWG